MQTDPMAPQHELKQETSDVSYSQTEPESPGRGLNKADTAPEPPYSAFTKPQRWLIIALGTVSATFSGFASNIYFPAIPTIASALGTTVENINLTVTSYMIFQAITPTFWGCVLDTRLS